MRLGYHRWIVLTDVGLEMKHAQCLNLVELMGVKNVDIFHAEPFVHIVSDAVRDCARSLSDEFSSPTAEKQSRADHHP